MILLISSTTFSWITLAIILTASITSYFFLRKKLFLEFGIGIFVAILAIVLPRVFELVDQKENQEAFRTLNRPYLEPTLTLINTGNLAVSMKNIGKLQADSSYFYFEYGKNSRTGTAYSTIAPGGTRENRFFIGWDYPLDQYFKFFIYYQMTIDGKTQGFQSVYEFRIDRKRNRDYHFANSSHTEKSRIAFFEEKKVKEMKLDGDLGGVSFWIRPENISKTIVARDLETKKVVWIGEEKELIFLWTIDSAHTIKSIWKLEPIVDDRNFFALQWEQTGDSIKSELYFNGESLPPFTLVNKD